MWRNRVFVASAALAALASIGSVNAQSYNVSPEIIAQCATFFTASKTLQTKYTDDQWARTTFDKYCNEDGTYTEGKGGVSAEFIVKAIPIKIGATGEQATTRVTKFCKWQHEQIVSRQTTSTTTEMISDRVFDVVDTCIKQARNTGMKVEQVPTGISTVAFRFTSGRGLSGEFELTSAAGNMNCVMVLDGGARSTPEVGRPIGVRTSGHLTCSRETMALQQSGSSSRDKSIDGVKEGRLTFAFANETYQFQFDEIPAISAERAAALLSRVSYCPVRARGMNDLSRTISALNDQAARYNACVNERVTQTYSSIGQLQNAISACSNFSGNSPWEQYVFRASRAATLIDGLIDGCP